MKLLIIDTETTDISSGIVCEIAATLYNVGDTPETTGAIYSVSTLIPIENNKAEAINGISPQLTQLTKEYSNIGINILDAIIDMTAIADYKVAFIAEFDAPIVDSLLKLESGNWICAMKDINWGYPAKAHGSYKLTDLCLWSGIGISTAHRAGDDVRLLVECFNRRKESLPKMLDDAIKLSQSPIVKIKARVEFEEKDLAKNAGFIWDSDRKIWIKEIRECKVKEFVETLGFKVVII
ncbi:3'-5' exonuclease [Cronbergia sp. UHCC 0137]|uniref:3'-5' exonuclease n=1 Tax=Cronbergia sp. UHCC 0137 TaxID=3110239 RepID=UPI002B207EA1|nr:3'-5' exonuclease [Cronbergia sp. UHCC 0137]MEA5619940.1 3'-5' exonuclease [Cronbergia sp. UHCC 0137]